MLDEYYDSIDNVRKKLKYYRRQLPNLSGEAIVVCRKKIKICLDIIEQLETTVYTISHYYE